MANSSSSQFKGFMIQAKDPAIHEPVGTFTTYSDAQTLDCFNGTAVILLTYINAFWVVSNVTVF